MYKEIAPIRQFGDGNTETVNSELRALRTRKALRDHGVTGNGLPNKPAH